MLTKLFDGVSLGRFQAKFYTMLFLIFTVKCAKVLLGYIRYYRLFVH